MKTLAELKKERAGLITQARDLLALADGEKRDLTDEEVSTHDGYLAEVDKLDADIKRRERTQILVKDLDQLDKRQVPAEGDEDENDPAIGLTVKEIEQYSFIRAINAAASNNWKQAGFERKASIAVADRLGRTPEGFFVPHDVLAHRRDVNVGNPAAGGYMVGVEQMAPIDLLRNRMVAQQAGGQVISGLVGDVEIPLLTGGATAYWVGEGGSPTESTPTTGQRKLTPHTVGAFMDLTRRFRLQTSPSVEALFRNDMMQAVALALDLAAFYGSGSGNQPRGIANTTGIGAPGVGATTWAMIVGLETAVAVDNADLGRMSYVADATARGALKVADVGTTTGVHIWATNNTLNGYPALVSNQLTAKDVFFGNFGDLIIALWSGLDVLVDTATLSTSGGVRVVMLQDADIAVRHPESFAKDATA